MQGQLIQESILGEQLRMESFTPAVEDARRRFILALRAMTVAKQREEKDRESVERWKATLAKDIRAYRRWRFRRRMRWVGIIGFVLFAQFVMHWWKMGQWWWLWFIFGGGAAADAAKGSRYQAARELAHARDPRAVDLLAQACVTGDRATRDIAALGLKALLPRLKASDAHHVTTEGMRALVALLSSMDLDLILATLKALEQVGDSRAIPAVQKLRASVIPPSDLRALLKGRWREWHTLSTRWAEVREAADECFKYLSARDQQEKLRTTLLRPAESPADSSSVLLRPAGAGDSTPVEQLLRPAE